MIYYQPMEWLMFFFVYCLFGWCFESAYVSLRQRHFVNRGFLTGPMLPIYGSGALVILFATLPFRENLFLMGLSGMIAATLLEYVTGVVMEAMFKVRYWDYSAQKFNFQGHICLSSSLAWGVMGILLVKVIHKPIERWVMAMDDTVQQWIVLVVSLIFGADMAHSLRAAFDLKKLLVKLDEMRLEMNRVRERIEAIEDSLHEDYQQKREQIAETLEDNYQQKREQLIGELERLKERENHFKDRLSELIGYDKIGLLKRNPHALSRKYREAMDKIREWLKVPHE